VVRRVGRKPKENPKTCERKPKISKKEMQKNLR